MDTVQKLFLEAMRAALTDGQVDWGDEVTPGQLHALMELAQEHHVLPMIFEAVHGCKAALAMEPAVRTRCRQATMQTVMSQALKTKEFLELNRRLRQQGIQTAVVKGIACRSLYPRPDYRYSGDEDVLCDESGFAACHQVMTAFGMKPCVSESDSYEVSYCNSEGVLYIELHKSLFARGSDIFGDCNRWFDLSRCTEITVQGEPVRTLCHTDHMLYLILHAFKHFLHSGFGLRQVCDMILFANAYGKQIDWESVLKRIRGMRAEKFAAALFAIGQRYLVFSPEQACYPRCWREITVDCEPLLADLLCGGIYGSADRSRVHSSNMTLNAVSTDKKGKKVRANVLKTVFPPAKNLESRFPYLQRHPMLLPFAWLSRIAGYAKESVSEPHSGASEVIRTGTKRVALLREYDIID